MREPLDPANLDRWIMLGLTEPDPNEMIPAKTSTTDLLAFAILCAGAEDLVEGMANGTRAELAALASMLEEGPVVNHRAEALRVRGSRARCSGRLVPSTA